MLEKRQIMQVYIFNSLMYESTVAQWGTFYFTRGTPFFCQTYVVSYIENDEVGI